MVSSGSVSLGLQRECRRLPVVGRGGQEAEFDTSLTDLKAMLKDEKLIPKDHTV